MPNLPYLRAEIERMRRQLQRQRREQSVKYPGTDKPIRGAIERRVR